LHLREKCGIISAELKKGAEDMRSKLIIAEGLPLKTLTLSDPQADWASAYRAIDDFLKGI